MTTLKTLGRLGHKAGPYLMLEIILPGGTLLALLLFLYRAGKLNVGHIGPLVPRAGQAALLRVASAAHGRAQRSYVDRLSLPDLEGRRRMLTARLGFLLQCGLRQGAEARPAPPEATRVRETVRQLRSIRRRSITE